jgi:hypothetical protein
MPRSVAIASLAVLPVMILACGGGPAPVAYENRTFYDYGAGARGGASSEFERRVPSLDLAADARRPAYLGVSVLGGLAKFSRPANWVVRSASTAPGARSIAYVSRNQYLVQITERADDPDDLWRDVIGRYEDEARASGAEVVAGPIPIATANAQGRAYVLKRLVAAAKAPFQNGIREYLVRGTRKIVLVQIVFPEGELPEIGAELLRVLQTMEID